jgi:Xaa-Pro aminopeptidase
VCIDAGPEVDGYVSDITRVFPVSSRFSSAQKDLYSAVLRVLKQCTSLATAQNGYTQGELHRRSVELLRVELERLGFNLRSGMLERLYPHSLSHWLGIDLHDTPTVERGTRLQEGHVLTIEPAVYVPQGDDAFPKAFWGMGIRIEDDVAVGYDSNVVLSAEAPREVEDVEAACAGWEEGVESVRREVSEQMRRTQ